MKVDGAPSGPGEPVVRLVIGRRWLPWRSRTRGWARSAWDLVPDWATPLGDDPVSAFIGLLAFVICLPLTIPALLISPLFLIESLLQWLCLPFAVLARMLGWVDVEVEVERAQPTGRELLHAERVRGWGAAEQRIEQIAELARHGVRPPYHAHMWPK